MNHEPPETSSRSLVLRAYRTLLRLLPFEFRADFGRDMEQVFADEQADVRERRSVTATLAFWLRTVRDFARTAPRQHWDVLRQDVRVGVRMLVRNPGFSATAILTLALGIGGSTSIFSVVYAVVLRPLAFPESERVVRIGWAREGDKPEAGLAPASYGNLQLLAEQCGGCELIGAMRHDSIWSPEKGSLRVPLPHSGAIGVGQSFVVPQMASASIFRMFGASTILGRLPTEDDEKPGAPPVAVINHATWTSIYGRNPGVIGQTLIRGTGNGEKVVTIVGVLAPGAFGYGIGTGGQTPVWSSLDPDVLRTRTDDGREIHNLQVYARLAPAARVESVRAELGALTPQLAGALPTYLATRNASLDVMRLRDQVVGSVRTPLLAFLGAVSCLLLVASVNVASLVLARAMSRRQEFAARFALGARPLRLARQLLTESALLAGCGGAVGLLFAWIGRRAFVAISPDMPRLDESGIGPPAVLFALVGMLLATSIVGLLPAYQASRRSVLDGLRRAGGAPGASTSFSKPLAALASVEVALVLLLLAGTGLLVNSFARLFLFDLGFDARSTIVTTIERNVERGPVPSPPPPGARQAIVTMSDRQRKLRRMDDEILQRVSVLPGVASAGLTGDVPFGPPYRYGVDLTIGDLAAEAALRLASPEAFDALRMRMTDGRWFAAEDRDGTPYVAVVNETMARRFWSERSPVGEQILFGHRAVRVIGVAADVHDRGARGEVTPTLYLSTLQIPADPLMLVVRPQPGVRGVEQTIAAELARMGERIKPGGPRRLEDLWWKQLADARFLTSVLSVFSTLALIVALVGVHGVLRFLVAQRTREMGIRKALGATSYDLVALVVGQALRFAVPGCIVGVVAALLAAPALRSLLFGVTPADPMTLILATAVLIAAVLAGAYFPARRASAVDPALSLRAE